MGLSWRKVTVSSKLSGQGVGEQTGEQGDAGTTGFEGGLGVGQESEKAQAQGIGQLGGIDSLAQDSPLLEVSDLLREGGPEGGVFDTQALGTALAHDGQVDLSHQFQIPYLLVLLQHDLGQQDEEGLCVGNFCQFCLDATGHGFGNPPLAFQQHMVLGGKMEKECALGDASLLADVADPGLVNSYPAKFLQGGFIDPAESLLALQFPAGGRF